MDRTPPEPVASTIAAALRRERGRLNISAAELARRAGIAKSTLSALEAGTGNPSVETLWALATATQVPFSALVDPPSSATTVLRAGGVAAIGSERSPFTSALLSACPPGARRDLHLISAEPGGTREAAPHGPGTVEHLLVVAGRWTAGPVGGEVDLDPGDYLVFPADRSHTYRTLDTVATAVLIMEYR